MIAEYLRKTRKGAGILIGIRENDGDSALDSLAHELMKHYSMRDYIVIEKKRLDFPKKIREYGIYTGLPEMDIEYIKDQSDDVIDQRVITGKEPLFMRVKTQHVRQRVRYDYMDRDADYPQTSLELRTEDCWIYFNAPLEQGAERNAREQWERSAFFEYLKNATKTAKV